MMEVVMHIVRFMGGDTRATHVSTPTKNGRRLLIIKDSFGNALPAFLFFSFEDIYVVDFRYFQGNIKHYATENKYHRFTYS